MMEFYALSDVQFWLTAAYFFLAFTVSVYIPGTLAVHALLEKRIHPILSAALAVTLGIVLWIVQGYVFGYLHVRFMTYAYLTFCAVLYIISMKRRKKPAGVFSVSAAAIAIIGSLAQAYPLFFSGLKYPEGVRFYVLNAFDGVMHLGFISSMVRTFPPVEPGAVPLPLTNYHYWSDLFFSELNRIWHIPVHHMYFQFMPVVIALCTGALVYLLLTFWKASETVKRVSLLFTYFSGNAAYLVMLVLHGTLGMSQTPALDNGPTVFLNVPQAFARPVFIAGVLFLHLWITQRKRKYAFMMALLFAALFGLKIYFGILAAVGLLSVFAVRFVRNMLRKKGMDRAHAVLRDVFVGGVFAVLVLLIYLPANKGAGGLYFAPLVWPKLILGAEKVNWNDWWLRMQVYEEAHNVRNIVILYIAAVCVFFLVAYGVRLLGIFVVFSRRVFLRIEERVYILSGIAVCTFLGMNTLQVSGGFNVFNFFVVSLFPLTILSGYVFELLWKKKYMFMKAAAIAFVLLSLPRSIHELWNTTKEYRSDGGYQLVSNARLDAYGYIRSQTAADAVLQTNLKNIQNRETLYAAFFTDRPTYLTGLGMLESHNQPIGERKGTVSSLFVASQSAQFSNALLSTTIDYLLLENLGDLTPVMATSSALQQVYANQEASVFKVVRD